MNRKLTITLSVAILIGLFVFTAILTVSYSPTSFTPHYTPPDPKSSIHITSSGDITAPETYNQTVPIERNGNNYKIMQNITLTIIVDKNDIVIDGNYFWVATNFRPSQGSPGFSLKLVNVANVTVRNVYCEIGVKLEQSTNCTVMDSASVSLYRSSGNVVSGCWGVDLNYAHNNTIDHCHLNRLELDYSNSNLFTYNDIFGTGASLTFLASSNNVIYGNNFTNAWWWIGMSGNSKNNYLVANNITITQHWNANKLVGTNYIYHNNFFKWSWDQSNSENSVNVWSRDGRGNYYKDAARVDGNSDGVIDVSFTIDQNNRDEYPLMTPVNTVDEAVPLVQPLVFP